MYIRGGYNHLDFLISYPADNLPTQLKKQVMLALFAYTCTYIYVILTVCRQLVQLLENI